MDWVVRSYNTIYSYCDEETEDFTSKHYLGLMRVSGLLLKVDSRNAVLSMIQLAAYITVFSYHFIAIIRPCFQLMKISFVAFSEGIHFCLLLQLSIIILLHAQFKRREILDINKAIANNFFNYSEPYQGIVHKLQREMYSQRKILLIIPILAVLVAAVFLGVSPIADQYGTFDFNKTMVLKVNDNLPYAFANYPHSTNGLLGYLFGFFMQILMASLLAATIGAGGFVYIVVSQNIAMQMKILLDSLEKIEERTILVLEVNYGVKFKLSGQKLYTRKEFGYCYNACLIKSLQHHQIIMRHFRYWTSLYSRPIFVAYLTGTIVIALSLLTTSYWTELPGTTVCALLFCVAEVGYMYLFSALSQTITDLNEDLRFQMHSIKWYHCDEGVKRTLRIFQEVTKRPMTLVAGGIVPANMDTFAKVMNSAYSYYNLANAFKVN